MNERDVRIISYNVRLGDVPAEVRSHQSLPSDPVEVVAEGTDVGAGGDDLERMLVSMANWEGIIYSFGIRTSSACSVGHHLWRWFGQLHSRLFGSLIIC